MQNEFNVCIGSDSYKLTHHLMVIEGTTKIASYFESRDGAKFKETVFFGAQYILAKYFAGPVVTREKIEEAATYCAAHFGNENLFNRKMWEHILNEHGGYLPVRVRTVPEGMPVPTSNVMMTVENLDDECASLTNHMETLLTHVWSASTIATLSRMVKEGLKPFFIETVDEENMDALDFMLQCFGFRGATAVEGAAMGAGHLINFKGTDTTAANLMIADYYDMFMAGFSIPATEHSIMTQLGRVGEAEVTEHVMDRIPTGPLSIVGDSFDIYNFCDHILGEQLFDKVMAREGGPIIVRPDSGKPVPVMLKCLSILYRRFGGHINTKGKRVLDPHIRIMWGDGLTLETIIEIATAITRAGWSMECIACFGMGGGLLQRINRDTQRFAFKCWAIERLGKWFDIFKDPIDGSKASKKGKHMLVMGADGLLHTVPESDEYEDVLVTTFEYGRFVRRWKFEGIRERAKV